LTRSALDFADLPPQDSDMKIITITKPVETTIGTLQVGVIGSLIAVDEARGPDGILRALIKVNRHVLVVPVDAYEIDEDTDE
jgi:hypothetical protein